MNNVILIGYLGSDTETRKPRNDSTLTTLSLATPRIWKDRESGEHQSQTAWRRLVSAAWLNMPPLSPREPISKSPANSTPATTPPRTAPRTPSPRSGPAHQPPGSLGQVAGGRVSGQSGHDHPRSTHPRSSSPSGIARRQTSSALPAGRTRRPHLHRHCRSDPCSGSLRSVAQPQASRNYAGYLLNRNNVAKPRMHRCVGGAINFVKPGIDPIEIPKPPDGKPRFENHIRELNIGITFPALRSNHHWRAKYEEWSKRLVENLKSWFARC